MTPVTVTIDDDGHLELDWRRTTPPRQQPAALSLRRPLAKAAARRPGTRGDKADEMRQFLAQHGGSARIAAIADALDVHRTTVQKTAQRHPDVFVRPHGVVALRRPD